MPQSTPRASQFTSDRLLAGLTTAAAATILLMLAALVIVLALAAVPSIRTFGHSFLTSRDWRPNEIEQSRHGPNGEVITQILPPTFGALTVIWGTAVSSFLALLFAVPLSLGAALFLVRVTTRWLAEPISFLIEFLAAIPGIALGLWGLFILCPFLQQYVEPPLNAGLRAIPGLSWLSTPTGLSGHDMFAAGIILAIMIVPIVTAITRDVLMSVPAAQVHAAVALGANWWQTCREMLKHSRSGIFGAIILGLARAAGETIAVTMVIGNGNRIHLSPLVPAQTMSSLLVNQFSNTNDLQGAALMEIALILLLMSLLFNVTARYLVVSKSAA
jgi:phosphate transport system permease protein